MNAELDDRVVEVRRAWVAASEAEWELLRWMSGDAASVVEETDHRELAACGRRERALLDELLSLAPAAPTSGWPGAWRLVRATGVACGRGGHRDAGAYLTRVDAEAELQRRRDQARSRGSASWEGGSVMWAAVDWVRRVPFDQEFWM